MMFAVNHLIGFGVVSEAPPPPTTNYANTYGSGDRTATVTATTNISLTNGTISNTIDGGSAPNGTDSFTVGVLATADGDYIRWQFPSKQYIDEITFTRDGAGSNGSWFVQGSDDGSSWTTYSTNTWSGTSMVFTGMTGMPSAGHFYWQIAKNGATGNYADVWYHEATFKIAAGV